MDNSLALYFDDDAIYGAVQPFFGKFQAIPPDLSPAYALTFLIDDREIRYGKTFQAEVRKGDPRAIGDCWAWIAAGKTFVIGDYARARIEILRPVLRDIRQAYTLAMGAYEVGTEGLVARQLPVRVLFSDNILPAMREQVLDFLQQEGLTVDPMPFDSLAAALLAAQAANRQMGKAGSYAVIEALHAHINLSLFHWQEGAAPLRRHSASLFGYGVDPRAGVIAKMAVDDANRQHRVLNDQAALDQEYLRQLPHAIEWQETLAQSPRPFRSFSLRLSADPNNEITVTIDKRQVDRLTSDRSQHIHRLIENTFLPWQPKEQVLAWHLIGNNLINSELLEKFQAYGQERIFVWNDADAIKNGLLGLFGRQEGAPAHSHPAVPSEPEPTPLPVSPPAARRQIDQIDVQTLRPGQQVAFSWLPNREVVAQYEGKGLFRIVQHAHSSVITGDTFLADDFHLGDRALLRNVIRPATGQALGDYKSGKVEALWLMG